MASQRLYMDLAIIRIFICFGLVELRLCRRKQSASQAFLEAFITLVVHKQSQASRHVTLNPKLKSRTPSSMPALRVCESKHQFAEVRAAGVQPRVSWLYYVTGDS